MPADVLRWPRIRPGDRVRLVSPASWPPADWLADAARVLTGWGLRVEAGAHALDRRGYLAGRDRDRLADLNDAFRDPGVRGIVATRGGAGAYRIVDGIDVDAVRADPKPVVGFSDITNLHLALWARCGLPTVHGCLSGSDAVRTARRLLTTDEPVTVRRDPAAPLADVVVPGRATGRLLGGNLSALVGFVGAGLPDLTGALLCIEDNRCGADPLRLDAHLAQLSGSGALAGVRGIALGDLGPAGSDADRAAVAAVCRDRFGALGVPVLAGLPFGHLPDQTCLPLGAPAVLDTTAGTLTTAVRR
ncbi:S66 peptidase family protein [Actinocatenispora rupis]|uniref:Peptidase S66 n=1 Tax=Actinocatenispora rupis TaxID=519421 RepID=A0A8J3NBY0_9ACTN|nr:LD-carboxypeptidase [Actinocatenispora rupis]GID09809.1 peptidase S66 [Actinocatenispora rupis]